MLCRNSQHKARKMAATSPNGKPPRKPRGKVVEAPAPPQHDPAPAPVASAAARHAKGFRSLGASARAPLTVAAAGVGIAAPDILLRWAEVVGEALAGLCHPVRVSYAAKDGMGATLLVQAPGARATEIEHLAPRIVERVNQFYGYRAISRLKITQATGQAGQAQGFAEAAAGFAGPEPSRRPGPELTARAAEMTAGIQDPRLRAALTRMGAHVLARAPVRG